MVRYHHWLNGREFQQTLVYGVLKSQTQLSDWTTILLSKPMLCTFCCYMILKYLFQGLPISSVQFSSVAQSCLTLCNPMNCSMPGLPVHHQHPEFTQTHVIESVMPSSHLILCHPLLLLPPIPPSIRVFSNESTLCMRWPKYWSFSFNIIPFKEHPGLISFRID